ncbi:MAG: hypothetical protein HY862_15095 [Chloroflexi bacterium]|nr:hypothetical protein [Chloroflexota bacterium]
MEQTHRYPKRIRFWSIALVVCLIGLMIGACNTVDKLTGKEDVVVPTLATLTDLQTAQYLTQVAPPEGFATVAFPGIDDNLRTTVYSHVVISVMFDGAYSEPTADDPANIQSTMRVEIWNDDFNVARQVRIEFLGNVFSGDASNLDVVRLSNNFYMLNPNGVCITDPAKIRDIATLQAAQLLGGVNLAQPTGRPNELVNGYKSWQYGFTPSQMNYPSIQTTNAIDILTGELWVAPEYNVVVSYKVEMNVYQATLLFGNRPVTGRIVFQYDVDDIGIPPSISVPNGC